MDQVQREEDAPIGRRLRYFLGNAVMVAATVFVITAFGQQPASQNTYSESGVYKPRAIPQRDPKKKDDQGTTAAVVSDGKPMHVRVSVLDSNWKPVAGLTKGDFKFFVDDQETEIASVETSSEPTNYVFMIDTSVSATMAIKDLVTEVERVVDQLAPGDRTMAIAFSERLKVISVTTNDREKLRRAIRKAVANPESGTSIYDHIQYLSGSVPPKLSERAVVILFTDGVDTTSRKAKFDTSLAAAESSDAAYYVIYLDTLPFALANATRVNQNLRNLPVPVGIKPTDPKQLRQDYQLGLNYLNDLMALSGGHTAVSAPVLGSKAMLSSELPAEVRSQYVITFTPRPGGVVGQRRQLNVRVNRPNLAVVARGSFITPGN